MRKLISPFAAFALAACATQATQTPKELVADTAVVFAAAQDWWIRACIHPIAPAPKFCGSERLGASKTSCLRARTPAT